MLMFINIDINVLSTPKLNATEYLNALSAQQKLPTLSFYYNTKVFVDHLFDYSRKIGYLKGKMSRNFKKKTISNEKLAIFFT